MLKVRIYGLSDPLTKEVMYVGKTLQTLKRRLSCHIHCAKYDKTPRDLWIFNLIKKNLKPQIFLIEDIDESIWREKEVYWISYYRNINPELTNLSDGGAGPTGLKRCEENLRNISEAKSKPIYQINKELEIVNEFPSRKIAIEKTKIKSIGNATRNSAVRSAGGFIWVYKSDYEDFKNSNKSNFKKPTLNKKINMYDKNNNLLKSWESPKIAAKDMNFDYKCICKAARGFRKTYRKYIWKYE